MYKGICLNPQLSRILGETGHTDRIGITDAGFPIPQEVERVDLAWKKGEPAWLDVCRMMTEEMAVEKIYLAEEMKEANPEILKEFCSLFPGIPVEFVSHCELKKMSRDTRAVVRTGEFSSFCNCILVAGVTF